MSLLKSINQSFQFCQCNKLPDVALLQSICRHIGRSSMSPIGNESFDEESLTDLYVLLFFLEIMIQETHTP